MDLSFWADVYGFVTGAIGKWSYLLVFVLGGMLLCFLWWGAGKSYMRQETAIHRADASDRELERVATEVSRLREAKPVVVNLPTQPLPPPLITVFNTRVRHDASKHTAWVMIALRNITSTPTSASITFEGFVSGSRVFSTTSRQEIVGGGNGNQNLQLEKDFAFTDTSSYERWIHGDTDISVHMTVDYLAGNEKKRYVINGTATAESPTLNITKNGHVQP